MYTFEKFVVYYEDMTINISRQLNGGSFHVVWGNVHSGWGRIDDLLLIKDLYDGGIIEPSCDYKAKYGSLINWGSINYTVFSSDEKSFKDFLDVVSKKKRH